MDGARIAVLGAGAWGTAIAMLLARAGERPILWGRDAQHLQRLRDVGRNERYLPEVRLDHRIDIQADLEAVVGTGVPVIIAVPSRAFPQLVRSIAVAGGGGAGLVWATKGFEPDSGRLLEAVVGSCFPGLRAIGVFSGPTFAGEVAAGLPAAVTLASPDAIFADMIAKRLRSDRFRVYTSDDTTGVQVGGAVKNVLAIAAGVADGLGFGANTRAALITRGLVELSRLGVAMGGRRETLMGLAGLGDLVLTCTDDQSRNRRFGLAVGRGRAAAVAEREMGQVVEGVDAARETFALSRRMSVEMPITEQVYRIVHQGKSARQAVRALLARRPGREEA